MRDEIRAVEESWQSPDENDALIWLKLDEAQAYQRGQRVFEIQTHTAKVRVQ